MDGRLLPRKDSSLFEEPRLPLCLLSALDVAGFALAVTGSLPKVKLLDPVA